MSVVMVMVKNDITGKDCYSWLGPSCGWGYEL